MDGVTADEDFFDELRPLCKVCLDGWNLLEGKCYKGCSRVKKVWNATSKYYEPVCCTCSTGYRMKNETSGECEKCT